MAAVTAADRSTCTAGLPVVSGPSKVAPKDARDLSRLFFSQLTVLDEGTSEHSSARSTLIEMNMSLVLFAAGRYRSR
ncbi:hypothetical protein QF030_000161 [Streptomyces rishiriensis]|uniref:RNA polymerase sigma factor SigF n=1 Tax=Streptomyces rishiriensis TaxID=68264 RepID=A0ABU0NFW3_STRRH|nr:hypothetical protein [Streptomyces rishiriensis]